MFVWKLRISKIILQVQLHNSLVIKEKRVWLTVLFFMRYVETVERDASASQLLFYCRPDSVCILSDTMDRQTILIITQYE